MLSFKEFIEESYETTMINGHPMININGEMKHTNNSNGKPIHNTEEGIRNFHKWFGNSKTVDEHGRPHVYYHGTSSNIDKFDLSRTGKGNDQYGSGFYFANNPETASHYSSASGEYEYHGDKPKSQNVIPVHVSIKNPIDKDDERPLSRAHIHALITSSPNHEETLGDNWGHIPSEGYHRVLRNAIDAYSDIPRYHAMNSLHNDFYGKHPEEFLKNFKKITKHDGVISEGGRILTAFSPNQVKSSLGNSGRFSKRKDEITESKLR